MKIVSWNVNGIRAVAGKNLYSVIDDVAADIFCFQETKATVDQVKEVFKSVNGFFIYANEAEKKGYSGVAIVSKIEALSVQYGIGIEEHDNEGRVVTVEYKDFYLVNVYIPNSGEGLKRLDYRAEWDKTFLAFANNLKAKKPTIITGDFNVAHQPIDLARPKENYNKTSGYTQVEIDGMTNFIESDFIDAFRYKHPGKVQYSFWSVRFGARVKNIGWRIDYFICSSEILESIVDSEILDQIQGSDHCPITLALNFKH